MVFFSCDACGESLKKNQVEKHYMTQCRRCESLSCVDCNKVFWGDEYKEHTKCITEAEKYSGKNYKPKPGANKGEKKQNEWFEQVQEAIDKNRGNKQLLFLLEKLKEYPNVPRKQKKFENFAKSSLNIRNANLVSQVWNLLMTNTKQGEPQTNGVQKENNAPKPEEPSATGNGNVTNGTVDSCETEKKKLSKRERKEERRKKANKIEKKDRQMTEEGENYEEKGKKKKKRKRDDSDDQVDEKEEEETVSKKRALELSEECQEAQSQEEEEEEEDIKVKRSKVKFDWIDVITKVLRKKGEISVKKLRKKVLAEYASQTGDPGQEEKLYSKFNKKIKKNPTFVVLKDRVKLKSN
ncbi:hypothetical protein FSP39_000694 [Pinctada imbricata]|uniref:Cell growth-regulating nucleolar protein n=1 Tax=Pinctada imbricata TaxID=66713 RepID=A0AA89BTT7_PINIB|nr:hypothetical protein FSP39_000694 [Pinctada imbricata]